MHQGIFIAIDGPSGIGKTTQTKLLIQRLRTDGYDVAVYSFPNHQLDSSYFVKRYEAGSYGSTDKLGAYIPALFYALDVYDTQQAITEDLKQGKVVIADGYVNSIMIQQASLTAAKEERLQLFKWINQLEFDMLQALRPDVNLVLEAQSEVLQQLRKSVGGSKSSQVSAESTKQLVEVFSDSIELVRSNKDGQLLSITSINGLLWDKVRPLLKNVIKVDSTDRPTLNSSNNQLSKPQPEDETCSLLLASEVNRSITLPISSSSLHYYTPRGLTDEAKAYYQQQMELLIKNYQTLSSGSLISNDVAARLLPLAVTIDRSLGSHRPTSNLLEAQYLKLPFTDDSNSSPNKFAKQHQLQPFKGDQQHPIALLSYHPRNELQLLPELIYPASSISFNDLVKMIDNLSYEEKETALKQCLTDNRSLNAVTAQYSFELLTTFQTFLQLPFALRIKAVRQNLTPHYGFSTPAQISKTGYEELFEKSFEVSHELYQYLLKNDSEIEAQYAVLAGYKFSWRINMSFLDIVHLPLNNFKKHLLAQLAAVHPVIANALLP